MSDNIQVVPDDADHDWTPDGYVMPDYDQTEPLTGRAATHVDNQDGQDVHAGGAR